MERKGAFAAIPAGATGKEATKEGKVNINTATRWKELKTLGVGEKKAEAIMSSTLQRTV